MSFLRSRGDKGSCMPLFTLEKFKKRLSEMLLEAGGGVTWTLLGEKQYSPPPPSSAVVGRYFFNEGFLWQTLLYIWHLTASLVQGRRKYRYLLTYSVRRSRKTDCGDERRRSFSPSQVYKLLNLCSICFSVLCALLSDEIKITSLLLKNSAGRERRWEAYRWRHNGYPVLFEFVSLK